MNERQIVPPGYITRERADQLTAYFRSEVDRIMRGIPDRVMARVGEPYCGKAAVAALMVVHEEVKVEFDQLIALIKERTEAGEEH